MPSPATAAAAAASAPLHRRARVRQHLHPASRCSLPSRALLNSACLTGLAPLPVHAPRLPPTAVFVPPHPLIKHWVSVLRNEQTPCAIFKSALAELGRLLIYEASRDWLPTITGEIETPVAVASVEFIDPREPVLVIPILRAGLALAEHASSVLPATKTYHLGKLTRQCLRRNEETLQPSIYLNNVEYWSISQNGMTCCGTIVTALDLLIERGVTSKQIKVVAAVAAPPALQKLNNKFPGLHVYTGIIDPEVNEKGYCSKLYLSLLQISWRTKCFIVPGLGDAGDRSFAT
ncbi:hypothetical protein HU200_031965 [Digitaria exilis]|uniref:uracil phosphoribosyltransferase n=1 Tax=Digitaria exilis TaxID=1010633 RepID=A0A835BP36_9POAL|nr:hypothetical protein HU200_031965 [Digitaria exilis]